MGGVYKVTVTAAFAHFSTTTHTADRVEPRIPEFQKAHYTTYDIRRITLLLPPSCRRYHAIAIIDSQPRFTTHPSLSSSMNPAIEA